jgi:hypothetical protein
MGYKYAKSKCKVCDEDKASDLGIEFDEPELKN